MNNEIPQNNCCFCISFLRDAYDYIKTKLVFIYRSVKARLTRQTIIPSSGSQPEEKSIQSRSSTVIDVDIAPSITNPQDSFNRSDAHQTVLSPSTSALSLNTESANNEESSTEDSNLCCKCKKPLDLQWINAFEKYWHPDCFRCYKCDTLIDTAQDIAYEHNPWCKPCYINTHYPICDHCQRHIQDSPYFTVQQENYHQQCYIDTKCSVCQHCQQPILEQQLTFNGENYHQQCFQLQCHYCGIPLTKSFFKNLWGEYYCAQHHDDPQCSNCMRHIDTSTDFHFGENMYTCAQCYTSPGESLLQPNERDACIGQLKSVLKALGMDITHLEIPIRFTGHQELNKKDNSPNKNIFGKTVKRLHTRNTKEIRRDIQEILIKKDMPRIIFCKTVIHELTHAWIFLNHLDLSLTEEEGLCEFMVYLWLEKQATSLANLHMQLKHKNPCPVYGEGFRKIHSLYNKLGSNLETLIERLASETSPIQLQSLSNNIP